MVIIIASAFIIASVTIIAGVLILVAIVIVSTIKLPVIIFCHQYQFWYLGLLPNVSIIIDTVIIVVIVIVVTLWAVQSIREAAIKGSAQVFWIDLRSHRRLQAILLTLIPLFFRSSLVTFKKIFTFQESNSRTPLLAPEEQEGEVEEGMGEVKIDIPPQVMIMITWSMVIMMIKRMVIIMTKIGDRSVGRGQD